jgi:hypothetical protein
MQRPTESDSSSKFDKANLIISFGFHAIIVGVLVLFAAHEGILGKQLKKIAVEMVHEKAPEKPKEVEKPKEEPPRIEAPKIAETPKIEPPRETPRTAPAPVAEASAPVVAPPPAELPAFDFSGGKSVQSSSNPFELYRGYVESALRMRWNRPVDIKDDSFVAEVEVTVNAAGEISQPAWKKSSGNARWDASVRKAIESAKDLDRRPPINFPSRVLVRFDVQETTEPLLAQ